MMLYCVLHIFASFLLQQYIAAPRYGAIKNLLLIGGVACDCLVASRVEYLKVRPKLISFSVNIIGTGVDAPERENTFSQLHG